MFSQAARHDNVADMDNMYNVQSSVETMTAIPNAWATLVFSFSFTMHSKAVFILRFHMAIQNRAEIQYNQLQSTL